MTLEHSLIFASTVKHTEVACHLQSKLNGPNPEAKSTITVTKSVSQLTWAIAAVVWAAGGATEPSPYSRVPTDTFCPGVCYPEVSNAEIPGNLPQCFVIINIRKSFLMTCESTSTWIRLFPFPFDGLKGPFQPKWLWFYE